MPASDVIFGVALSSLALIDSVDVEDLTETKVLKGSNGVDARVHTFNPTTKGSVKGHGTTTVAVGIGDPGVEGVSGGVTVIPNFKYTEKNDDFSAWEYNFENYPSATSI
jgi:hypothetical protein